MTRSRAKLWHDRSGLCRVFEKLRADVAIRQGSWGDQSHTLRSRGSSSTTHTNWTAKCCYHSQHFFAERKHTEDAQSVARRCKTVTEGNCLLLFFFFFATSPSVPPFATMERIDRGCGVYFAVCILAPKAAAVKNVHPPSALPSGPTKEGVLPTCWKNPTVGACPTRCPPSLSPKPQGMIEKERRPQKHTTLKHFHPKHCEQAQMQLTPPCALQVWIGPSVDNVSSQALSA